MPQTQHILRKHSWTRSLCGNKKKMPKFEPYQHQTANVWTQKPWLAWAGDLYYFKRKEVEGKLAQQIKGHIFEPVQNLGSMVEKSKNVWANVGDWADSTVMVWCLLSEAVCSQLQRSTIQMCTVSVSTWLFGIKSSITVKTQRQSPSFILLPSQSHSAQAAPLQAWRWWCSLWRLVWLVF